MQVTPEQLEEVWEEVEQGQASVSRVEGEVQELARKVGAAQGQVEAALGQVAASISGGQAAIESVLEEGLRAMDTKLERVKEDLLERLEVKEKRSLEQGSLITKEQMDQVPSPPFQGLRLMVYLPIPLPPHSPSLTHQL